MALRGAPEMYVIRHVKTGTYWRSTEARGLAGCWVWNRMLATCYTFSALQSERFPEGGVAHDYYTNEPVRVGKTVTDLESLVAKTEQHTQCFDCRERGNCDNYMIGERRKECTAYSPISPTKAPREVPGLLSSDAYSSRILPIDAPADWTPVWGEDDWTRLAGMGVARD